MSKTLLNSIIILTLVANQAYSLVYRSINNHGLHLLRQIYDSEKGKNNIFFSPLSIASTLSMVFHGSIGQTREELASILTYDQKTDTQLKKEWNSILDSLDDTDKPYKLLTANGLFIQDKFEVQQSYQDILLSIYKAKCESKDFSDPTTTADINKWISRSTNGKIENFFNSLNPNTVMLLINAVYFKGQWLRPFEKSDTKSEPFKNFGEQKVMVPIMKTEVRLLSHKIYF